MRDVYTRWLSDRNSEQLGSARASSEVEVFCVEKAPGPAATLGMTQRWERVAEGDQSAALAETDFSDDDLDREDGFDSDDDDDFDSAAGFDSVAGFDAESLDDAVVPLVAGLSVVVVESESVPLGVLFLA
jgi:hypothetical protein